MSLEEFGDRFGFGSGTMGEDAPSRGDLNTTLEVRSSAVTVGAAVGVGVACDCVCGCGRGRGCGCVCLLNQHPPLPSNGHSLLGGSLPRPGLRFSSFPSVSRSLPPSNDLAPVLSLTQTRALSSDPTAPRRGRCSRALLPGKQKGRRLPVPLLTALPPVPPFVSLSRELHPTYREPQLLSATLQVGIADVRTILESVNDEAVSGAVVVVQAGMTPSAKKAITDAHHSIWCVDALAL
jgi:hypothetical protein